MKHTKRIILCLALLLTLTTCFGPMLATNAHAAERRRNDETIRAYTEDMMAALTELRFAAASEQAEAMVQELVEREQWTAAQGELWCQSDREPYGNVWFNEDGTAEVGFSRNGDDYYGFLDCSMQITHWTAEYQETGSYLFVDGDGNVMQEYIETDREDGRMHISGLYDADGNLMSCGISEQDGNRPSVYMAFDADGTVMQTVKYSYDADGNTAQIEYFDAEGNLENTWYEGGTVVSGPDEGAVERILSARAQMLELSGQSWKRDSIAAAIKAANAEPEKAANAAKEPEALPANSPNTGAEYGTGLVLLLVGLVGIWVYATKRHN